MPARSLRKGPLRRLRAGVVCFLAAHSHRTHNLSLTFSAIRKVVNSEKRSGRRSEGREQEFLEGLGEFCKGLRMTRPWKNPVRPQPTPDRSDGVGEGHGLFAFPLHSPLLLVRGRQQPV